MSVDRGFTWMDDETLALINIFSKDEIQQELNGSKRNIGVYECIAAELSEIGFRRTAYQCREKIKRLRKEYHLAKYCIENNLNPKKPMKYYDLVDKLFNQDSPVHNNNIDVISLSSDHEDELHLSFKQDQESDTSNSCTGNESFAPQTILPGTSCPVAQDGSHDSYEMYDPKSVESTSANQNDSDDTLLLNGDPVYDLSDKDDSPADISDSPWVPNVVLVENDGGSRDIDNTSDTQDVDNIDQEEQLQNFYVSPRSEEPPQKKRKTESNKNWFKKMLDGVTETFLSCQENSEAKFLDRICHLERERMKRDENMQRLWLEFEERRRKEEQQHELKMLSLLGQFIHQINGSERKEQT